MTPNRSISMTSDMIDQMFLQQGEIDERSSVNYRQNGYTEQHNQISLSLSKLKINEYKAREQEMLEMNNKAKIIKKPFNEIYLPISKTF